MSIDKKINIWRAKFNTGEVNKKFNPSDVFNYCKSQKIVGIGWGYNDEPKTIETAIEVATRTAKNKKDGFLTNIRTLSQFRKDDLVWVLNDGKYYIGRILSYNYRYIEGEYHICNIKDCEFYPVKGYENVPGKIRNSFNGTRHTLDRIRK